MTTVEQAKQDRDAHWDSCRICTPPWLDCAEGVRLFDVLEAAVTEVNWMPLP